MPNDKEYQEFLASKGHRHYSGYPDNVQATIDALNAEADAMSEDEGWKLFNRLRKNYGLPEVSFEEYSCI